MRMRLVSAVMAGSALLALIACVDDAAPSESSGPEDAAQASSDAGTPTSDAGAEDAADALADATTADADAGPPPCVTGQTRSETRPTNRLRSLAGLATSFGSIGTSGPDWLNPINGKTSDNQYTTVSFPLDAGGAPNTESAFLVADSFGFKLPPGAEISGIEVQLEWRGSVTAGSPAAHGGPYGLTKAGVLYSAYDSIDLPTTEATTHFGDASTLWGSTWGGTDVNDIGFGTAVYVRPQTPQTKTANVFVDAVAITVNYVCP